MGSGHVVICLMTVCVGERRYLELVDCALIVGEGFEDQELGEFLVELEQREVTQNYKGLLKIASKLFAIFLLFEARKAKTVLSIISL